MEEHEKKEQLEQILASQGYLSPASPVLELLPDLISDYLDEFFWSDSFEPHFVISLMSLGFLPMSHCISRQRQFLLPKLHQLRCIVTLDTLNIPKNAKRLAKDSVLKVNTCFDLVMLNCRSQHADGWLGDELLKLLHHLHRHNDKYEIKLCSFEIWREGRLTAGELGYVWGQIYTSMTGYYTEPGDGTVQMSAMAGLLFASGIQVWDLGMPVDYKERYGCQTITRQSFEELRQRYSSASLNDQQVFDQKQYLAKNFIQSASMSKDKSYNQSFHGKIRLRSVRTPVFCFSSARISFQGNFFLEL